jgi:DNA-binding response OmpR family regulator
MDTSALVGRSILIVEDEPLVALDIVDCFRNAGASVLMAHRLNDGIRLAGHPDLSAAVVDFGLSDGEGTALCERLNARGIPFILHSGYSQLNEACRRGVLIAKPASPSQLVDTMARMLTPA